MTNTMTLLATAVIAALTVATACGDSTETSVGDSPVAQSTVPTEEPDTPADEPDTLDDEPDATVDAETAAESIVEMSEQEAAEIVEAAGLTVRVAERDGEQFPLTEDYRTDRINLTIVAGVITAAYVG